MKLKQTAFLALGLFPMALAAQPAKLPTIPPPSAKLAPQMPEKEKLSYVIGMYFGKQIETGVKRGGLDVDPATVEAAIKDLLEGKASKYSDREAQEVFAQLRMAMEAKRHTEEEASEAKGKAYLSQFGKNPGVTTLPDGLEYKVLKEGAGPMPKPTDRVVVAYRGSLIDGTVFDQNENFTVMQNRVIQGWQKVLPMMKVGSKWQIAIPPDLGYGPRGGPRIPGNSVLLFDIELKSIVPGAPAMPLISSTPPKPPAATSTPVVSGEIIKVPSAEDLKRGAKIEVIKAGQTNAVPIK